MGTKMTPVSPYREFHNYDSRLIALNNSRHYAMNPMYRPSPPMVPSAKWGYTPREMTMYGSKPNPRFYTSQPSPFIPIPHQEDANVLESGKENVCDSVPTPTFQASKNASPSSLRSSPTGATDLYMTPDSFSTARRLSFPSSSKSSWAPPTDVTVCRVVDPSSFDSPARRPSLYAEAGGKSPRPWSPREEQDPIRRSKIKTELCMHYESTNTCPFGSGCTYAHGEEELQLTKLMDLHRAGLVDVQTYRTKPCITWVSTGSCPFGKRCTSLHDPRVAGSIPSWLPHTETQGNTIATDINVDGLYQKKNLEILHDNPFGDQFSFEYDDYESLYSLICNIPKQNKRRRSNLTERHKIEIALNMRGNSDWQYKFRPQHVIYDELCMVLQNKAFKLKDEGAVEIDIDAFDNSRSDQVLVREIAFGPDSDPTVRGVSLWFNVEDKDLTLCTPQQAKRYRWKRGLTKQDVGAKSNKKATTTPFDSKECFAMIRPFDDKAFRLATDILNHRLKVLRAGRISNMRSRFTALKDLDDENLRLQAVFENDRRHWLSWAWPANRDPNEVTDRTPAPKVDSLYKLSEELGDESCVDRVWNSFVDYEYEEEKTCVEEETHSRLSVFVNLLNGEVVSDDECFSGLPHISPSWPFEAIDGTSPTEQSERCWRALRSEPSRDVSKGVGTMVFRQ